MSFLDETRVYLTTLSADYSDETMSSARWFLKAPIAPPNPLYKIQVQFSNAVIPNTFHKVSPERGNDGMTFAWGAEPGFSIREAFDDNRFTTVRIKGPIVGGGIETLLHTVTHAMERQWLFIPGTADPMRLMRYKPRLMFDTNLETMTFVMHDWTSRWTDHSGSELERLESTDTSNLTAPYGPSGNPIYFKLITKLAVDSLNLPLQERDYELAHVLGFTRWADPPPFGFDYNDPYDYIQEGVRRVNGKDGNPAVWGVCRAPTLPVLTGTRFIKVITNLAIKNIDPNTKSHRYVAGCIPVTDSNDQSSVHYSANVVNDQYTTIARPQLDMIEVSLEDDRGRPLPMHRDWFVEFSVRMREPESIDKYGSLSAFTGPAVDFHARGDPGRYRDLYSEMESARQDMEQTESSKRTRSAMMR